MNDWQLWEKTALRNKQANHWTSQFEASVNYDNEWKKVYSSYLKSQLWNEIRKDAIDRARHICQKCYLSSLDLQVHHKNYDRIGGKERPDDLLVVCPACHKKADLLRDADTYERRERAFIDAKLTKRLDAWAKRRYGDMWQFDQNEEDIEEEFINFLWKQRCKEIRKPYSSLLDYSGDEDYEQFHIDLENGDF